MPLLPAVAQATPNPPLPMSRAAVRSLLLTAPEAARATAFRGTVYATHDAFPICMNLPTGFLCAHTFDSDTTRSPFPTMAAVHVTASDQAARTAACATAGASGRRDPRSM